MKNFILIIALLAIASCEDRSYMTTKQRFCEELFDSRANASVNSRNDVVITTDSMIIKSGCIN